ncbi:hypothetical protein F5Y14DRAFT_437830 [Nemania sp. NC0429]|nr:hypothetical protein F5Y14DRAFT_437830 [Nemania sp. NC0429]
MRGSCIPGLFHFLTDIGPANASLITELRIRAPALSCADLPDKIVLSEESIRYLRFMQEKCTRLTTLHLEAFRWNLDERHELVKEYHRQLFPLLEAIPSLRKVVLCSHQS